MDQARVHFVQRDPDDGKNGSKNVHAPNIIDCPSVCPRNQAEGVIGGIKTQLIRLRRQNLPRSFEISIKSPLMHNEFKVP